MIGGTSIGSLMGALWAQTRDIEIMKKRAKKFSGNMSQLWRKIIDLTRVSECCESSTEWWFRRFVLVSENHFLTLLDILQKTYPITAMFSGKGMNNEIRLVVGDTQIEDLWIPYFWFGAKNNQCFLRIYLWQPKLCRKLSLLRIEHEWPTFFCPEKV